MIYAVFSWYPSTLYKYVETAGVVYVSFNRLAQDPPPLSGQIWPRGK